MHRTRIAALAAIEDDVLLMSRAEYRWDEESGQYDVPTLGDIVEVPREMPSLKEGQHHQGDLDEEPLIHDVIEFAKTQSADVFGFSTFGAVVDESGYVRHFPADGKNRIIYIPFGDTVRRAFSDVEPTIFVQNDASAAALGEALEGAGSDTTSFCYLWVGRGVNIGVVNEGGVFRAKLHPEVGHMPMAQHPDDPLKGQTCPIHNQCVTSLCSYLSLLKRQNIESPPNETDVKRFIAGYLGELCASIALFFSPEKIAVGGYSLKSGNGLDGILPMIRSKFQDKLGIYPRYDETFNINAFIGPALLGNRAALVGISEVVRRGLTLQIEENP